jgi:hypothetical protein
MARSGPVFDPKGLTGAQCFGEACVVCHRRWPRPRADVGRLPDGSRVFACDECVTALRIPAQRGRMKIRA